MYVTIFSNKYGAQNVKTPPPLPLPTPPLPPVSCFVLSCLNNCFLPCGIIDYDAWQVGLSGGGKSTIAALLSRFYTPTRGDILVDGVPVDDLDRKWLTQKIALVGQNPALFTGYVV